MASVDRGWRRILAAMRKSQKAYVKVGVLQGKGADERHKESPEISLVELAAIHEFGAPKAGIPERSFIRRTMRDKRDEFGAFAGRLAKGVLHGRLDIDHALDVLGLKAKVEVQNTIAKGPHLPPPLSPATVAKKGSSRPLVDTGQLVGSIDYEVVRG